MRLQTYGARSEIVNGDEDYTITTILEMPTLVYADRSRRERMHKGVAFKDTTMMRQVAQNMLRYADIVDEKRGRKP